MLHLIFPTKGRNYLLIFLVIVAGAMIVVGLLIWQGRVRALAQAEINTSNLAWVIEDHIDGTLRRADAQLINLSKRLGPEALSQAAVSRLQAGWTQELASYKTKFPEISNFYVFDREGRSLYASAVGFAPFSVADREHFQRLKSNPQLELVFSEVVVARSTGRPTVSIARALRDGEGRFAGMVAALLDFGYFQSKLESLDVGSGGLLVVRNSGGHKLVLRQPPLPEEYNKPVKSIITQRIDAGERSGTARLVSPVDGIARTFGFRRMERYPFSVTVAIADKDALALWRAQSLYAGATTLVVLLAIGLLLRRVWRGEKQRTMMLEELQRQELVLREAKVAADAANVAKSTFLASMSHELRTPLNAVLGFAQLLRMNEKTTQDVRDSAREIETAGRHILVLVNDILDLARIESGRMEVSSEEVRLDEVLGQCLQLIRIRAQERNIGLDCPDTSAVLRADPVRLRQVLLNLLSNAVKYNHPDGQVRVRGEAREPGRYRISVTDTGPGIAPERMGELFKPFNRMGVETGPVEGTGIGLVITQSLVTLMNGSLGVESTPGIGSTFWVELPLA